MAGKQAWTDAKVKNVFDTWRSIIPFYRRGANGRTWQEAANELVQKKAGMHTLGIVRRPAVPGETELDDLDFFPFPEIDSTIGQDAIEAPIDGFMIAKKARDRRRRQGPARSTSRPPTPNSSLPEGRPEQRRRAIPRPTPATYNALQKKAVELVVEQRQAHLPVPGPRHPAGLRLHRDDPGDPAVPRPTRTTSTRLTKNIEAAEEDHLRRRGLRGRPRRSAGAH